MSEVKASRALLSKSVLFQLYVKSVILCQQDESLWFVTDQKKKNSAKFLDTEMNKIVYQGNDVVTLRHSVTHQKYIYIIM